MSENCSHIKSFSQVRQPKFSNLELVALNLTAEYISYYSEYQLFKIITHDVHYLKDIKHNLHKISQLDGQFAMNINFAKTFNGLLTRIISKIMARTIILRVHKIFHSNSKEKLTQKSGR